jgi:uncharacterized Zn finger protein
MSFTLSNFEKHIDRTILARGRDYFKSEAVISLDEIDEGHYEAEVQGSETYQVEVETDGDEIM